MSSTTTAQLIGTGGTPPYTFAVVSGAGTTIPASISGSTLTVDATALEPGVYAVEVRVTDAVSNKFTTSVEIDVLDQNALNILNRDTAFQPSTLPYSSTITLSNVGGTGTITWALLSSVTNLPGASLSGNVVSFTVSSFDEWSLGVRATDSIGNTVTKVITVTSAPASTVSVSQGHALITVEPQPGQSGAHQFTLTVADSAATAKKTSFNYIVNNPISSVDIKYNTVDNFWYAGDTTEVIFPIAGDLNGFQIGAGTPITTSNGLTVTVDPSTQTMTIAGPPNGSYGNSEVSAPITILRSSTQVATITKEFTLISHSGTSSSQLGNMNCYTRPYIVGEFVGLNPERPFYNSPSIFKNSGYTVQVATGSSLPTGLSLDSSTGLIYGYVLDNAVTSSVVQYVDSTNTVQGSITITWDIIKSNFQLIDLLDVGQLQVDWASVGNNYLLSTSSAPLVTASVHRGTLPAGVTLGISVDGTKVLISGAPTSAGWSDIWFSATDANGQTAYFHKRIEVRYASPLVVLTDSLQRCLTSVPFSQTLLATGGFLPYTWAITSGTLPTGITLNANSGVISGITAQTSASIPLVIQVTDSRGVTASTLLTFTIDNSLTIISPPLPLIIPGINYSFQFTAEGGTTPYTWQLASGSPSLPGGFTISSGGVLSGATSLSSYTENIIVQVKDVNNSTVTQAYNLTILGITSLTIDQEGIGPIVKGSAYHGTLSLLGTGYSPYQWSVATDTPNPLPNGLTLTTDQSNNGATATLAGTVYTNLYNYSVKIQVVDHNGNVATAFLFLSTDSSLEITTTYLPQATVTGTYSTTLAAQGYNTPFNWSIDASSPTTQAQLTLMGLSLSAAGVLYGTPNSAGTFSITFRVTDSLGDFATATLPLVAKTSTLAITTVAPISPAIAGSPYSFSLGATGGAPGYSWSVSPNSGAILPTGLNINASTGVISGTSYSAGYNTNITFRVTDTLGVYRDFTTALTVTAAIKMVTGPDYINGTTTNYLGVVALGDVSTEISRPNFSFYIFAENCISTSSSGISLSVPSGFSYNVDSYTSQGGNFYLARIKVTGPFGSTVSSQTTSTFNVTIHDSGVSASSTFTWATYPARPLSLRSSQTSGANLITTLPLLENVANSATVFLVNSNQGAYPGQWTDFLFPSIPGQTFNTNNLPNLISMSGDNQNLSNILAISGNGESYNLTYNAGSFQQGVASTNLTFTAPDIAWMNASNNAADLFQYTSSGGGSQCSVAVQFLFNPGVASVSPTTLHGGGESYQVTVSLTKPLAPSQSNTNPGFYGNGGLTVTGVSANTDGNGFTTGWTVTVQTPIVPYGTNATGQLGMAASGPISYLQGNQIVSTTYSYHSLQGIVANITLTGANRTAITEAYPPYSINTVGVYQLSYESSFQDASGVNIDKYDVSNTNNSNSLFYQWAKVIYYLNGVSGGNGPGGSHDMNGMTINVWLGAHAINSNNNTINVAIGFLSQNGITWSSGFQTFVMNNHNAVNMVYHGINVSATVPTTPQPGYGGNGTNLTAGTFYPNEIAGIVFFINPVAQVVGNGDGANGGLFVGTPSAQWTYWQYS